MQHDWFTAFVTGFGGKTVPAGWAGWAGRRVVGGCMRSPPRNSPGHQAPAGAQRCWHRHTALGKPLTATAGGTAVVKLPVAIDVIACFAGWAALVVAAVFVCCISRPVIWQVD